MLSALQHTHSGLRWVVLGLLIFAIINSISRKTVYEKKDKMIYLFSMIFAHIQLLLGIGLLFLSGKVSFASGFMKEDLYRFYGMEHFLGMLIAIVLITIGRRKAENGSEPSSKQKSVRVYFGIALLVIIAMIPWPFREALAGGWF